MTDQSVFDDKQTPQDTPANLQQPSGVDPSIENLLQTIKNERGEPKYDSLQKALDGLRHSQEYIPTLKAQLAQYESELATLRQQNAKTQSLEELVERLTARQDQQVLPNTSGLDEQTVQDLVLNTIQQREAQTQAVSNVKQVDAAIKGIYGDKAGEVVVAKAKELGISLEEFKQLSAKSPKMVIEIFKPQGQGSLKPNTSSVNTSRFQNQQDTDELERPSKSLLAGASSKDQVEYMRKIRERVYKRHNVET